MKQALALLCAALALPAATARAAEPVYIQYACQLPDGTPAPADGFVAASSGGLTTANLCSTGGGLEMRIPSENVASQSEASWTFTPPPGIELTGFKLTRSAENVSGSDQANRVWLLKLDQGVLDSCSFWNPCEVVREIRSEVPGTNLALSLSCPASPCRGPAPGPSSVTAGTIALTLRDPSPPTFVSPPAGAFLEGPAVRGTQHVEVRASDAGSGVFQAQLIIDGVVHEPRVLDNNGGRCAKPFVFAAPCPASVSGSLPINTDALSPGRHTLRLMVTDATEVNQVVSEAVSFTVADRPDETQAASVGTPPPGPLRISGRAFRKTVIRLRMGSSRTVTGRLLDSNGTALAGTELSVVSTADTPGAKPRVLGKITTDSDGRFQLVVPTGPSRVLFFKAASVSAPVAVLRVVVPAPLRLMASRDHLLNGQTLFLTSYLLGTTAPPGSADVAFQVRIGHQWRTFATRPLRRHGRARVSHRFTVTFHPMTYRFRAIIVRRRTFPYGNATSPAIQVRVNQPR